MQSAPRSFRRTLAKCACLLGGSLLLALSASATTYYVDNSGDPQPGVATADGSESKPWGTINAALSSISAGDTILVKSGTYQEEGLYIRGPSGTPAAETRLLAFPGHHPRIRGPGNSGRIAIDGVSYFLIAGFDVSNLNHCLVIRNGSHHIAVRDCDIHDSGNELVRVHGNCHDILFEHNSVHDGGSLGGTNGEGFYIGTSGERDNTHHITIRHNTVYSTASEGIELKPGTHDCMVEGNNVGLSNTGTVPAAGIEVDETQFYGANPLHVVRNNIVHDTGKDSDGIRAGTGCLVYNNIIYGIARGKYGVVVDNRAGDVYVRRIYHNTIDLGSANAVALRAKRYDVRNNLGPATTDNLAIQNAFFANSVTRDYHLAAGCAPLDAGADLSGVVTTDFEGTARPYGPAPDLGAYEYAPPRKYRDLSPSAVVHSPDGGPPH